MYSGTQHMYSGTQSLHSGTQSMHSGTQHIYSGTQNTSSGTQNTYSGVTNVTGYGNAGGAGKNYDSSGAPVGSGSGGGGISLYRGILSFIFRFKPSLSSGL